MVDLDRQRGRGFIPILDSDDDESGSRVGYGMLESFYLARSQGNQTFTQALRLAAFRRFSPLEVASGQVEYELFEDLKCASELSPTDATMRVRSENNALARRERVAAASLVPLRDLAAQLNLYSDEFRHSRNIKVSADDNDVCFQWFDQNGKLATRKIPRKDLGASFISGLGAAAFITDGRDDSLDELLRSVGVEPQNLLTARFQVAAKSVRIPAQEPAHKPDLVVTGRSRSGEPGSAATDVTILKLDANGDAGIVKLDDGSIVLVDTGYSDDIVARLQTFLARNYGSDRPAIRLIITQHKDHIGGLSAILAAGYRVDELIIGRCREDAASPDILEDLRGRLKGAWYTEATTPSISHFVRQGVTPWIDPSKPTSRSDEVESFVLYPAADTTIALHHTIDGRTPNDAGFIVKLTNKGTSWLLTDDMSARTMESMIKSLPPNYYRPDTSNGRTISGFRTNARVRVISSGDFFYSRGPTLCFFEQGPLHAYTRPL